MFKVFPVQTTVERQALCKRLGAEFHPDDMAYRVTIEEEEAGVITFFIKGKKGCIRELKFYPDKEDFEVMFIAGRACMNFLDSVVATDGCFISPAQGQERLITALGYKKQPDCSYYLDTTGFFVEHCKHEYE